MAAIIIAGRQLDGHIDRARCFIDRHLTPGARIAGVFPRSLFPGVVAELTWARNGVEDPEALAGAHIESPNVALLVCKALRRAARKMRGAHQHDIARDDRSGMKPDFAGDEIHRLIVVKL